MRRKIVSVLAILAAGFVGLVAPAGASTSQDGAVPALLTRQATSAAELQAQIDLQLDLVPGGKQTAANEVSYDGGRFVVTYAAHVGGFNAGNVGIALLGTFTDRSPTPAARRSLTHLLASIADRQQIDPLADVDYVNPISGATRTVAAIPGHRDWAATLCPGDVLAGELAAIRQDVADMLD